MTHLLSCVLCTTAMLTSPMNAQSTTVASQHVSPAPNESLEALLSNVRQSLGATSAPDFRATGVATLAGIEGPWVFEVTPDGRAYQRISGPLSYGGAVRGEDVWLFDLGGEIRETRLIDRDAQRVSIALLDHRWLRSPSLFTMTLDAAASNDQRAVIDFALRDGRLSGEIEIDRATHRPSVWRFGAGDSATEVTLSDWAPYLGTHIPRTISTAAAGGFRGSVTVTSVEPATDAIDTNVPPLPADDVHFNPALPAALEVVRAPTGHLLVHPLVNGKDVGWFIFDTGAGMNVLTTDVIESLGIARFGEIPANGIGGRTMSFFCRPDALSLGPVTIDRPLMVGLDLSFLDAHMGKKIAGLIGFGFLARTVVELDLSTPSIAVFEPRTFERANVHWERLDLDQRIPHVEARFSMPGAGPAQGGDGAPAERLFSGYFRLDTGAAQATVSMHEPAVRELELLQNVEATDGSVGGVGGRVKIKQATMSWFELGGRRTPQVRAEFAVEARGAFADPYSLGNIGGKLLSPFVLVFDYQRSRIGFITRPNTPERH